MASKTHKLLTKIENFELLFRYLQGKFTAASYMPSARRPMFASASLELNSSMEPPRFSVNLV